MLGAVLGRDGVTPPPDMTGAGQGMASVHNGARGGTGDKHGRLDARRYDTVEPVAGDGPVESATARIDGRELMDTDPLRRAGPAMPYAVALAAASGGEADG